MSTAIDPKPRNPTNPNPRECDALIIALQSRRVAIVRRDQKIPIWSAEQICRPVRSLSAGERVYYKGEPDVVRAITTY